MKAQKEYVETTNRYVYNRSRKKVLSRTGKISCSYCQYNRDENSRDKWYGKIENAYGFKRTDARFPSWKLVCKNRKQWQAKRLRKQFYSSHWARGYKFVW